MRMYTRIVISRIAIYSKHEIFNLSVGQTLPSMGKMRFVGTHNFNAKLLKRLETMLFNLF